MNEDRIQSYLDAHRERLELLKRMWLDPKVQCYNDKIPPTRGEPGWGGSVFLAGPTSYQHILEFNWRCYAVKYLRDAGFKGWIFIPESRGEERKGDYPDRSYIHNWESSRLFTAKHMLFWIPRNNNELFGLNTNHELGIVVGMIYQGAKASTFIGWPDDAIRMGLPGHYVDVFARKPIYTDLKAMCEAVAAA